MKKAHRLIFLSMIISMIQCVSTENTQQPSGPKETPTDTISLPSKNDLRSSLYDKDELLVVYAASPSVTKAKWNSLFKNVNTLPTYRNNTVNIIHKSVSQVTEEDVKTKALFLIGTSITNTLIPRLTEKLPISYNTSSISFGEATLDHASDVLELSGFHNPNNLNNPIYCIIGNDEKSVYDYVNKYIEEKRGIYQSRTDYQVYRGEYRIITGSYDRQWNLNTKTHFDYSTGIDTIQSSEHYRYISHQSEIDKNRLANIINNVEKTTADIISYTNVKKSIPKIDYHIYHSAEQKGLLINNTKQASIDLSNNSVHTIHNETYDNNLIQNENRLVIHHLLGEAKTELLSQGFSIFFTKLWQKEGYLYWSARLSESENTLSLVELFDEEDIIYESDLIKDCLSGSLVSYLIELWGKDKFLKNYTRWNPSNQELTDLEEGWQNFLANLEKEYPKKTRKVKTQEYTQGFNFAHEGYSIYNGYLSTMASRAIEKQAAMGCNSLALVPYTSMRDIHKPVRLHFSRWPGGENDQGMVHSSYIARQNGMTTMLKPQIWIRGSWPGDVKMNNEEDWDTFFDYYHRWIRHYAFLAEIHQIEMLCVGVEFAEATLSHPQHWERIITNLRKLYQGQMTYAANWGEEFEGCTFWDCVDFIGLNCYYPLSKKDQPSKKELRKSFEGVKKKIKKVHNKYDKPIMFTEIGFRSIDDPWQNPHAYGDGNYNEDAQQLCYEVIFDGIEDESWYNGILWWKFPSYLDYGRRESKTFTPNNKKAESTVSKWFLKRK